MNKIFKLNNIIETALENAIDETGEIVNEQALCLWENAVESKNEILLSIACEVKNIEAESEALKNTIETLSERKKIAENKIKRIKTFLTLQLKPGDKLKDERVQIGWRKSVATVIDKNAPAPEKVDPKYTKTKIEFSLTQIKELLEAGDEISWAKLQENQNIQIK